MYATPNSCNCASTPIHWSLVNSALRSGVVAPQCAQRYVHRAVMHKCAESGAERRAWQRSENRVSSDSPPRRNVKNARDGTGGRARNVRRDSPVRALRKVLRPDPQSQTDAG